VGRPEFRFPGSLTSTFLHRNERKVLSEKKDEAKVPMDEFFLKYSLPLSLLLSNLELSDTHKYMSLKYEPASEPLHIYVKAKVPMDEFSRKYAL